MEKGEEVTKMVSKKKSSWFSDKAKKQQDAAFEAGLKKFKDDQAAKIGKSEGTVVGRTEAAAPTGDKPGKGFEFTEVKVEGDGTIKKDASGTKPPSSGMDDVEMKDSTTLSAKAAGGGDGGTGTQETPVLLNTRWELGVFTETRSAILPLRFYLSMNKLDSVQGVAFNLRLNAPYNLTTTAMVSQTAGATRVKGVSVDAPPDGLTNTSTQLQGYTTGITLATGQALTTSGSGVPPDVDLHPAWRLWYQKLYDSYHVVKTEYRVKFRNARSAIDTDAVVYYDYDVSTANNTGNTMPTNLGQEYYKTWKHVQQVKVAPKAQANGEKYVAKIEGTWVPGSIAKNTVNATDIKTWYTTGAAPTPAWTEQLSMVAFLRGGASATTHLEVEVDVAYYVQYRDLKDTVRYPYAGMPNIDLTTPNDNIQVPFTLPQLWLP